MLDPRFLGDSVQGLGADQSMGLEQMGKEAELWSEGGSLIEPGGPLGSVHLVISPGLNSKRDLGKGRVVLLNE